MKKSHECEVATHIGPESCGAARKGGVEALTGGCKRWCVDTFATTECP
jgi:hypothetical protein